MVKKEIILVCSVIILIFSLSSSLAYEFNGTVYNASGVALNNTVVNITLRDQTFTILGYNATTTNASGAFNMTISENTAYLYQPVITLTENGAVTFIGQSLPALDYYTFISLENMKFYLRPAGTFNISVYNSTFVKQGFMYMILDQRLGYPIAEQFGTTVTGAIVSVPRDRNYTVMVFPNESLPVFYDWSNFSSDSYLNLSSISKHSHYNATSYTLHKEFNITMGLVRLTGYMNNLTGPIDGWDNLSIVPLLLGPSDTLMFDDADLPYNMSGFWSSQGQAGQTGDRYNLSTPGTGYYNITLPAPAEGVNLLLFGAARNNSNYYGGYANISLTYGGSGVVRNISLYGLTGNRENISMSIASAAGEQNITTLRKSITLLNQSNATLSSFSALIKTTVNYSAYGAIRFTYLTDIDQEKAANFTLPFLNVTGIDEMSFFTQQFAPKKVSFTTSQVNSALNVTLKAFSPAAIDGSIAVNNLFMALYFSNSSCDIPSPPVACQIGSTDNMATSEPLKAVMGGGKISFRMKTGNMSVHYVNVDMLASGPPDVLFDDSTSNTSGGDSFAAAARFGSGGPTIYDFILVGFPYSDGVGGLNEANTVNLSVPYFYSENWSVIWNVTLNGTDASALAGNYSAYVGVQSAWQVLMNANNSCGTSQTSISVSAPCYINKSTNEIWLRIPHFSGTGPKVSGSVVAATTTSSSSSSSSSSSGEGAKKKSSSPDKEEIVMEEEEEDVERAPESLSDEEELQDSISLEEDGNWLEQGSISLQVQESEVYSFTFVTQDFVEEKHEITVQEVNIEQASVTLLIESEPQEITLFLGTGKEVDLDADGENDLLIIVDDINSDGEISLQFTKLESWKERETLLEAEIVPERSLWIWLGIGVLVVVFALVVYFLLPKKKQRRR